MLVLGVGLVQYIEAVIMVTELCRGECGGRTGVFPSSFVRVVDAFPGDGPAGGDCSSYLGADLHSGHEYDNTRPVWGGLDSGLRAAFGGAGAGPETGPVLGARLASQLGEKTRSVYCSVSIQYRLTRGCSCTVLGLPDSGAGFRAMELGMSAALHQSTDEVSAALLACTALGYTGLQAVPGFQGESVDVRPYGIALFEFSPQFENELGLRPGEVRN